MSDQDEASRNFKLKVVEDYNDYEPPFDVKATVICMMASLPAEYLLELGSIVLTNKSALSRKRLTSTSKSRKRKVRIANAAGLYHGHTRTQQAWIEIFVDSIYRRWTKGWWLKIRFLREDLLGKVLFHEVGHHIHYTKRPEFREREDVADDWSKKLLGRYNRKHHAWLFYCLRPFMWFLKPWATRTRRQLDAKYAAQRKRR